MGVIGGGLIIMKSYSAQIITQCTNQKSIPIPPIREMDIGSVTAFHTSLDSTTVQEIINLHAQHIKY